MKPPFIFTGYLESKHKYIGFSLYSCLLLAYIIVLSCALSWSYTDFGNTTVDYFLLLENWRQPTIVDIVQGTNDTCPNGYSPMIPYKWSGTKTGCDCSNALSVKKISEGWLDLDYGSCTADQNLYGCNDVKAQPSKTMSKWSNGTLLCNKLSKDTFLSTAKLVDTTGNCPSGYIKCSTSGTFDSDNVFCSSYSSCPINSLVYASSSPSSEYSEQVSIPGTDKRYIGRETRQLPFLS